MVKNKKKQSYIIADNGKKYTWKTARYDATFKGIFCGLENKERLEKLLSFIFKEKVEIIEYITN